MTTPAKVAETLAIFAYVAGRIVAITGFGCPTAGQPFEQRVDDDCSEKVTVHRFLGLFFRRF